MQTAVFAQDPSNFDRAASHYADKNYQASGEAYDLAFEGDSGTAVDYYNAACSWSLAGDTLKAMAYLRTAAEKGWKNTEHIRRDDDLERLRNSDGWEEILSMVESNRAEYEKDFDQVLKAKLESLYIRDQTLRQLYSRAEEKFGKDSDEMKFFWEVVAKQDSANEKEVVAILDKHGWVGKSTVGGKANMTLWLVIQHAPLEVQEKYLPLMEESVRKGESSGRHLAMLHDRILMRKGEPQIYGTQIVPNPETGENEVYLIAHPEKVDERRASIGLGPLEEYLQRFGLSWEEPE
jgi:hypothetical protein